MARRYKIKRTSGRIYNPIRGKLIKGGLVLLATGLLFLLGWLVYEPVYNALTANREPSSEISESSSAVAVEPETEPEPETTLFDGSVKAAFAPAEVFADDELWGEFLSSLGKAGLNAVVFDIKNVDGVVTYASEQESVAAVESQAEEPVELSARVEQAKEAGITAIARVYAFEDPLASTNDADMAIRYMEADGVVWLDDALEQGGRSWLNPYSETAQKYVLDVVYDAISAGCDCVLLDGVRFPPEFGIRFAYFGGRSGEVDRRAILDEFMQKARTACDKRGVELLLGYSGEAVFTGETDIYGGSPMVLPAGGYSASFLPSELVGVEGLPKTLSYASLPSDLGAVIKSMVEALSLATDAEQMPYIQAYDLSASDILTMTAALSDAGIDDYILYSPESADYLKSLGGAVAGEPQPENGESDSDSSESSESSDSSDSSGNSGNSGSSSSSSSSGSSGSSSSSSSSSDSSSSGDSESVPEITLPTSGESIKQAETFGNGL